MAVKVNFVLVRRLTMTTKAEFYHSSRPSGPYRIDLEINISKQNSTSSTNNAKQAVIRDIAITATAAIG